LKGASVLLFKNEELRKYQYFAYSEWPGGLFISPSMPGTRGGGPIAAAYASMLSMGTKGYMEQTQKLYDTCEYLKKEIGQIGCLMVLGNPMSSLFAFRSTDPKVNIFSVADEMEKNGWKIECQNKPDSIHCTSFPKHIQVKEKFIEDLKDAVNVIISDPEKYQSKGKTGMYGMTAVVPDEVIFEDFLKAFLSKLYQ
jgi:sphinganine-1-phosphate aldolase